MALEHLVIAPFGAWQLEVADDQVWQYQQPFAAVGARLRRPEAARTLWEQPAQDQCDSSVKRRCNFGWLRLADQRVEAGAFAHGIDLLMGELELLRVVGYGGLLW